MTPIFVSYFTQGTGYEVEAAELAITLRQFDLPHDIHGEPNLGSWQSNVSYKATFIRDMMLLHDDRPIVWLDADARVRLPPILLNDLRCDMAFHRRDGVELLSGTLFISPTKEAWETVKLWKQECDAHPATWDQRCLDAVVQSNPAMANFAPLPAEYCAIFDGDMCDNPVIEHMQASRRLRNAVANR